MAFITHAINPAHPAFTNATAEPLGSTVAAGLLPETIWIPLPEQVTDL